MSKIADLVKQANESYAKAKKDKDSIERMRAAIQTISGLAHTKGKT